MPTVATFPSTLIHSWSLVKCRLLMKSLRSSSVRVGNEWQRRDARRDRLIADDNVERRIGMTGFRGHIAHGDGATERRTEAARGHAADERAVLGMDGGALADRLPAVRPQPDPTAHRTGDDLVAN